MASGVVLAGLSSSNFNFRPVIRLLPSEMTVAFILLERHLQDVDVPAVFA